MLLTTSIAQVRAWRSSIRDPVGFVPTMGALHRGHLDLVRRARAENTMVVVSIFVNPLQFGVGEDLARYPRDLDGDREKLAEVGADVLFAPNSDEIYPPQFVTNVDVGALGDVFEGVLRPGHFRGVATVLSKLLHLVAPARLYLGQKDAQQCAVVRSVLADLAFDCEAVVVPTTREADGLALSSRNQYLDAQQRAAAPSLYCVLERFAELLRSGVAMESAKAEAAKRLQAPGTLDYLACVDADSFVPLPTFRENVFLIAAARFGATRLLDNLWFPR